MNDTPPTVDPRTGAPFGQYDTVASRAQSAIERGVASIVERTVGDPGFVDASRYEGDPFGRKPHPEHAINALCHLRVAVDNAVHLAAQNARARGTSWLRIAEQLGLAGDDRPRNSAERAFNLIVGGDPDEMPAGDLYWRCTTCGQHIRDRGPFESAPYNCEEGHADDCRRHSAEVAAYERTFN